MRRLLLCIFWCMLCIWQASAQTGTTLALKPERGDGSAANPFQIDNLAHLRWASEGNGSNPFTPDMSAEERAAKHYLLTNDIDAAETKTWSSWTTGVGFFPLGQQSDLLKGFQGSFDGGYHKISNLYTMGLAFVYRSEGATIKNLGLEKIHVQGGCAGLVGIAAKSADGRFTQLLNCYVTGLIEGKTTVGALVGHMWQADIRRCYSWAELRPYSTVADPVTAFQVAGGLVGNANAGSISECYAVGKIGGEGVATNPKIGGLVGYGSGMNVTAQYNYWDAATTGTSRSLIGIALPTSEFAAMRGMFSSSDWSLCTSSETTPVARPYLRNFDGFKVEVTAGPYGSIFPATREIKRGQTQVYEITPLPGCQIEDVKVNGVSVGKVSKYTISGLGASATISATFLRGEVAVELLPAANGQVSPQGKTMVPTGGKYTCSLIADEGYKFTAVDETNLATGITKTKVYMDTVDSFVIDTVNAPYRLQPQFMPLSSRLTTQVHGVGGRITPSYTNQLCYYTDAPRICQLVPDPGYRVAKVLLNGVDQGKQTTFQMEKMKKDVLLEAWFEQVLYPCVSMYNDYGTISPQGTTWKELGASHTVSVTPNAGYLIDSLFVNGVSVGALASYTVNSVDGPYTFRAVFKRKTYKITTTTSPGGTVNPLGEIQVAHGDSCVVKILPNAGREIWRVEIDKIATENTPRYVFWNVQGDHTLAVTFARILYTMNLKSHANGGFIYATNLTTGIRKGWYGDTLSIQPKPNTGYRCVRATIKYQADGRLQHIDNPPSTMRIVLTDSMEISGDFQPITTVLHTEVVGTGGRIVPSYNNQLCRYDDAPRYSSLIPDKGYRVDWAKRNGLVTKDTTFTFHQMLEDVKLQAAFTRISYPITLVQKSGGVINGPAVALYGDSAVYSIVPDRHIELTDVQVDGVSVGKVFAYTLKNIAAPHRIEAFFQRKRYPVVATRLAYGSISPADTTWVLAESTHNYQVTPSPSHSLLKVRLQYLADGTEKVITPTDPLATFSGSFQVNGPTVISATLQRRVHTVTVEEYAGTSLRATRQYQLPYGDSLLVNTSPTHAKEITRDVTLNGKSLGAMASYKLYVTGDSWVRVYYHQLRTKEVRVSQATGGSISPAGIFQLAEGDSMRFTIATDKHYKLKYFFVNGNIKPIASDSAYVVKFPLYGSESTVYLRCEFERKQYAVDLRVEGKGYIKWGTQDLSNTAQPVVYGDSLKLNFYADAGYGVSEVEVDGERMGPLSSYTFRSVDAPHTLKVVFSANIPVKVTRTSGGVASAPTSMTPGNTYKVSAQANKGYRVDRLTQDGFILEPSMNADSTYAEYKCSAFGVDTTRIHVTFRALLRSVSAVVAAGEGTLTPSQQQVELGKSVAFRWTPALGYTLGKVLLNGKELTLGADKTGYTLVCDVPSLLSYKLEVFFEQVTGLEDLAKAGVKVWPNPASEVLRVSGVPAGRRLQLFDLQGRMLHTAVSHGGEQQLPLSSYPTGIYLLHIEQIGVLRVVRE